MQSAKGKDVRTLTFEPLEFYQTEQMHELISDNAKTKYNIQEKYYGFNR